MDSSRKGFSSSRKIPNPSFSGESDENEFIPNDMDRKSPDPKKPGSKHFMSPTESAKAKVVVKRVLGERIESLASCDGANVPPKPHRGGRYSACSYNSKSDDEDVLSTNSWDASLKPYDPRTNYESPRPKFLRYKPNKSHGILSVSLNSQNQEFIEGDKGSESDQEPQECSSESSVVEAEKEADHAADYTDNEEEEEEEEGEELEEEKVGSLKWLVKFLLLLATVTLSTSYIATMYDPTPSPVVEAVGALRDGFHHMHRYLSEAVFLTVDNNVAWVNGSSGMHKSDVQAGFLEMNSGIVHITEPSGDDGEMQDDSDWSDLDFAEEQEADGDKETDPLSEFEITESDEAIDQEPVTMDAVVPIPSGIIDDCQTSDGDKETDRLSELEITESAIANDQESDAMDVVVQLPSGIFNESKQLENDHHSSVKDEESFGEMAVEPIAMASDEPVEAADATATMSSDEPVEVAETTTTMASDEPVEDAFIVESEIRKGDSELQATEGGGFNPVEVIKSMRLSSWLYILFITVMASLVGIYYSLRPKQARAPVSLHEVAERKEELAAQRRPLVEFQHKPAKKAVEETAKEQQHAKTQEPIVELLAELDIQEPSSSLRSRGQKGKVRTEESVHFHAESRTPPVGQVVSSVSASSSGESSSLGSFTAEKSVLRKARKEKVEKVVPTPVRRSSRIRNLSITSP